MNAERFDPVLSKRSRLTASAQHQGNIWSVNVCVKQAGFVAQFLQREREIYRQGGFTYTTLAGTNSDDRADSR